MCTFFLVLFIHVVKYKIAYTIRPLTKVKKFVVIYITDGSQVVIQIHKLPDGASVTKRWVAMIIICLMFVIGGSRHLPVDANGGLFVL